MITGHLTNIRLVYTPKYCSILAGCQSMIPVRSRCSSSCSQDSRFLVKAPPCPEVARPVPGSPQISWYSRYDILICANPPGVAPPWDIAQANHKAGLTHSEARAS